MKIKLVVFIFFRLGQRNDAHLESNNLNNLKVRY